MPAVEMSPLHKCITTLVFFCGVLFWCFTLVYYSDGLLWYFTVVDYSGILPWWTILVDYYCVTVVYYSGELL